MAVANAPQLTQLVSAKEVAAAWGCSVREIAEKARRHEIPSYKIGRLVRFDVAELEQVRLGVRRGVIG